MFIQFTVKIQLFTIYFYISSNESYHKRRFNDQGNTVPSTKRFNGGGGYSGRGVGYNQGRGSYSGNNLSFGRGGGYNQRGGYGGSPSGRGMCKNDWIIFF